MPDRSTGGIYRCEFCQSIVAAELDEVWNGIHVDVDADDRLHPQTPVGCESCSLERLEFPDA